ncbi:AfsA-related hotdog domain-containing protein [Plantactinospora veratri]|uniref:AfsA-related hotdog domain-containing protein n=1 Tax=Plantactinospora veratri TaxID=1436122 RepID=A0ABU7SGQ0_9ACTN
MQRILVVGDRFATSIDRPDVRGLSQFLAELRSGRYDDPQERRQILLGQCLNGAAREKIEQELSLRDLTTRITIANQHQDVVHRSRVHKRRQENVLLADVERIEPERFRARLSIDVDNELVLDHVSGWHISGMVINEAARQMILAVTEGFYATDPSGPGLQYLLHSWTTRFDRFLFPVDATVLYTVDRLDARRPDRLRFDVSVDIMQNGTRAAQCTMKFSAMNATSFTAIEKRMANELLDDILRTPAEVVR